MLSSGWFQIDSTCAPYAAERIHQAPVAALSAFRDKARATFPARSTNAGAAGEPTSDLSTSRSNGDTTSVAVLALTAGVIGVGLAFGLKTALDRRDSDAARDDDEPHGTR